MLPSSTAELNEFLMDLWVHMVINYVQNRGNLIPIILQCYEIKGSHHKILIIYVFNSNQA